MPKAFLLGAAAVGLALRLAFGLGYWVDEKLNRDEVEYLSLARSLASGHGFVFDEPVRSGPVEPYGRAPGYPAFLALVGGGRDVPSSVPTSVKVAQSLAGALGVLMVGVVAWNLAGARAAKIAAAIAACYPPLVWIAAYAFSEALFWPLGLCVVWYFDRVVRSAGRTRTSAIGAVLCGALIGVAILVRAATLIFLPLSCVWLLWRRRPATAVALVLGAAIVIGPWTVRNYRHYGHFVLVATDGGVTFWTGNSAHARGEGDQAANPELKRDSASLRLRYGLGDEAMEPIYYQEALAWIRTHPIDWLTLEAKKLFYLIVPIGPSYTLHSPRYHLASVVSYGLLLPVAMVGVWRLGRRRSRTAGLWLLAASAIAVCLVFFPQERFRIPILDPTLIICASGVWATREESSVT